MGHIRILTTLALLSACAADATDSNNTANGLTEQAGVTFECDYENPAAVSLRVAQCMAGELTLSCVEDREFEAYRLDCLDADMPGVWWSYESDAPPVVDLAKMRESTFAGGTLTMYDCAEERASLLGTWCSRQ